MLILTFYISLRFPEWTFEMFHVSEPKFLFKNYRNMNVSSVTYARYRLGD